MYTNSETSPNVMPLEHSYGINVSWPTGAVLPKGTVVKLLNTGLVAAVTAASDVALGVVTTPNKTIDDRVTIITNYRAVVKGKAAGIVATGAKVDAVSLDATSKLMNYTTSVGGGNAVGIVLQGGASGADIKVGLI